MTDITCPHCEQELTIGAAEQFFYRGLPVECVHCGGDLGDMGYSVAENTFPWRGG